MAAWTKTSAQNFARNVNKTGGTALYLQARLGRAFNGAYVVEVHDKQSFSNPTKNGTWRQLADDTQT